MVQYFLKIGLILLMLLTWLGLILWYKKGRLKKRKIIDNGKNENFIKVSVTFSGEEEELDPGKFADQVIPIKKIIADYSGKSEPNQETVSENFIQKNENFKKNLHEEKKENPASLKEDYQKYVPINQIKK